MKIMLKTAHQVFIETVQSEASQALTPYVNNSNLVFDDQSKIAAAQKLKESCMENIENSSEIYSLIFSERGR